MKKEKKRRWRWKGKRGRSDWTIHYEEIQPHECYYNLYRVWRAYYFMNNQVGVNWYNCGHLCAHVLIDTHKGASVVKHSYRNLLRCSVSAERSFDRSIDTSEGQNPGWGSVAERKSVFPGNISHSSSRKAAAVLLPMWTRWLLHCVRWSAMIWELGAACMASSEWLVSAEAGPPWLCGFVGPASPSGFATMIFTGAVQGFTSDCWLKPSPLCFFFFSEGIAVGSICFTSDSGSWQMVVGRILDGAFLSLLAEFCRLDTTL